MNFSDKRLFMKLQDYTVLKPSQVFDSNLLKNKMYAIVSVEKMFFKKPEVDINTGEVVFYIKKGNKTCSLTGELDEGTHEMKSTFPCDRMDIDGETVAASAFYCSSGQFDNDYRIEYIGISDKSAIERLSNGHKTLSEILAIFNDRITDRDLYVILFNVVHFEMKVIDPNNNPSIDEADIEQLLYEVYDDEYVVMSLCEACLINIFKPEYNSEYKTTPSNYKFKTLETLYNYGYDTAFIMARIDIPETNHKITLYTDTLSITFEEANGYTVGKECPFILN